MIPVSNLPSFPFVKGAPPKVLAGCIALATAFSLINVAARPANSQAGEPVDDAHREEHRQEDGHIHGVVEMNAAVEGSQLYIELISPAANIVGFEHVPSTDEQEAAVDNAIDVLEGGEDLFGLPAAAACDLVDVVVESDIHASDDEHSEHEDEHSHHEAAANHDDEHSEHEEASNHDDEHSEHEAEHHEEEVHSEFVGNYEFDCANPEQLQQIDVGLFEAFPGIEEIEVQALTDSGQVGKALTPTDPVLSW